MITVNELTIKFGKLVILKNISFQIKEGQKVALSGASGAGKSTLLSALMGFVRFQEGEIFVNNKKLNSNNIREIRKTMSWLPQQVDVKFETIKELFFSIFELKINRPKKPQKEEIEKIFDAFNLDINLLDKRIDEVSGGQKQRIVLSSICLLEKPILFLDEPTSALDDKSTKDVIDFLFSNKKLTIVAATHNKIWKEKSDLVIEL